ncbi:pali-domain-containing protein [Ceratobasidium sp. AG-I]|nr:pali-domain-containing protein [Ceratobasidium sp. AG-I]
MQLFKAATPGFLTTLAATALLAVVSFSVPYFKTVYFLKAAISQSGVNGTVTFGVLGYCLDFNNQVSCSNATVGWEFNPNALLGNDLPIQIPNVVVKWLTYALVLHIVALGLAGISAVFGLLAHVREMTMSCFSSCISGMAAAVCLIAFIFDLVLFFAVRARVNKVEGGSASIGNGLWLTLAAWVLLFFSGCMFAFGRDRDEEDGGKFNRDSERMRLDAVKAEADRKALQAAGGRERGLPAFYEYERTPLRKDEPQYYEEEVEVFVPYKDGATRPGGPSRDASHASRSTASRQGGSVRTNRAYEPGAPGTRAIDDYYNNTAPVATGAALGAAPVVAAAANTYPPQRQPSQDTQAQNYPPQPQRYQSPSYDPYAQQSTAPQRFQSPSHDPYAQPPHFVDPYAQSPPPQGQRVDPYLAVAGYAGGHGHQGEASCA